MSSGTDGDRGILGTTRVAQTLHGMDSTGSNIIEKAQIA